MKNPSSMSCPEVGDCSAMDRLFWLHLDGPQRSRGSATGKRVLHTRCVKVTRPRTEMPEVVPDLRPLRGRDTHTLWALKAAPPGHRSARAGCRLGKRVWHPPNPQESPVGPRCVWAGVSPKSLLSQERLFVEGWGGCGVGVLRTGSFLGAETMRVCCCSSEGVCGGEPSSASGAEAVSVLGAGPQHMGMGSWAGGTGHILIELVLGSLQGAPGLGEVGHRDGGLGAAQQLEQEVVHDGQRGGGGVVRLVVEQGSDNRVLSRVSEGCCHQAPLVEAAPLH